MTVCDSGRTASKSTKIDPGHASEMKKKYEIIIINFLIKTWAKIQTSKYTIDLVFYDYHSIEQVFFKSNIIRI